MRRWSVVLLPLVGCTPVLTQPGELAAGEPVATAPAALPTVPEQAVDEAELPPPDPEPPGSSCPAEDPMSVSVFEADVGESAPPHYNDDSETYVFAANLDGRPVRVELPAYELTFLGRGNGNIIDLDVLEFGGGVLLLSHHNLDEVVDPPRFFRSRWSEAYWLPPASESGDCPQTVPLKGKQHHHAWSPAPETLCIADALGQTRRLTLDGETLRHASEPGACEPRLARQRDWTPAPDEAADPSIPWQPEEGSSKARKFALGSKLDVFAVNVEWTCEACHEDPDDAPVYESTRLVVRDRRGDAPRSDVYYASIGSYCKPKRRGKSLQCGERSFTFPGNGVVVAAP